MTDIPEDRLGGPEARGPFTANDCVPVFEYVLPVEGSPALSGATERERLAMWCAELADFAARKLTDEGYFDDDVSMDTLENEVRDYRTLAKWLRSGEGNHGTSPGLPLEGTRADEEMRPSEPRGGGESEAMPSRSETVPTRPSPVSIRVRQEEPLGHIGLDEIGSRINAGQELTLKLDGTAALVTYRKHTIEEVAALPKGWSCAHCGHINRADAVECVNAYCPQYAYKGVV